MIADIIINTTAKQLQKTFSYIVPVNLDVHIGSRVLIPFGTRHEEGIVVSIHEKGTEPLGFTLKPIQSVLSTQTGFHEEMIETALWISQYYVCNLSDALRLFMIEKKGLVSRTYITLTEGIVPEGPVLSYVASKKRVDKGMLSKKFDAKIIDELLAQHRLTAEKTWKNTIADKTEPWVYFCHDDEQGVLSNRKRQAQLLSLLKVKTCLSMRDIIKKGFSRDVVHRLCGTGLVEIREQVKATTNLLSTQVSDAPWKLTEEQAKAVEIIRNDHNGRTYVLHGVTSSGKTEVYMQLAADVLAEGKQVFILVPEIALTGQIVRRFLRRFGNDVVVMHSQLSKGERRNNWLRMQNGESHICIGARSAVFTAARSIGLFIVDEAHDSSYKQDESPRYHAVEVARKRAAYYGCPVILGSATPSIADYYRTQQGEYVLIEMNERVGHRPLPTVTVVDMRDELARGNYHVLSDSMVELLQDSLAAHQQSIILLNRRGFSTFVMCRKCGYVVKCDTCDVAMVYHKNEDHLKCHYCDAEKPVPTVCPSCGSKYIKFFGTGTEKVEEQLHELLPTARIIRLDQDTTTRKNSGDAIVEAFRRQEYDILLGTQMVAKGHDFANVSAVGILSADSLLNLPAYWAGERTFQLLTQAAGRAGRGDVPGRVVMQTYAPDHYVIQCAAKQDYASFYEQEIAYRKELLYPPFQHIIKILIVDEDEKLMWQRGAERAENLRQWLKGKNETVEVIGPYVDVIKRIRNKYRIVILIKGTDMAGIKKYLSSQSCFWEKGIIIDVDPSF